MNDYDKQLNEIADKVRQQFPVCFRHLINVGEVDVCPSAEVKNGVEKAHGDALRIRLTDELYDKEIRDSLVEWLINSVIVSILQECGGQKIAFSQNCITMTVDDDLGGLRTPESNVKYISAFITYLCEKNEDNENDKP